MSSESTVEKDEKRSVRTKVDVESSGHDDEPERDEDGAHRAMMEPPPTEAVGNLALQRPSSAQMIWTIAKREISAYFNSALAYIVIASSLVVLGLYFFFYKGGFWQVDRATMVRMFEALPLALCFLTIPLFTMRALSDEKRVGTIELLITMPVKDSEVILGKYVGALAMMGTQLALIAFYPIVMFFKPWHIGDLDWNPFWVGMLGLFLLSMAGTAVGLMWSSFTESQILSYFATALTLLALYSIGSVTIVEFLQGWMGDAVSFISLQTRLDPFSRGIIDTRNVIYFLSLTVLCLMVAFRSLESRKWT